MIDKRFARQAYASAIIVGILRLVALNFLTHIKDDQAAALAVNSSLLAAL